MTINFGLLSSPVQALHSPETVIVTRERLSTDSSLYELVSVVMSHQRNSVPVHPFLRFSGTLAVTRTVHVSPSSITLTFICVAPQTRPHIHLHFSAAHFKTPMAHLNAMILSTSSSIGQAVYFLKPDINPRSLAMSGC